MKPQYFKNIGFVAKKYSLDCYAGLKLWVVIIGNISLKLYRFLFIFYITKK